MKVRIKHQTYGELGQKNLRSNVKLSTALRGSQNARKLGPMKLAEAVRHVEHVIF